MQPLVRKDLAGFYIILALSGVAIVLAKKYHAINHFLTKRVFKSSSITRAELGWFYIVVFALGASLGWDINYWWFKRLARWTKGG
ncbi:hypothetical protein HK100_011901, partial [Physocladia obscura]